MPIASWHELKTAKPVLLGLAFAALAAGSDSVVAQGTGAPTIREPVFNCTALPVSPAAYHSCRIRQRGRWLLRGDDEHVIDELRPYHIVPLSRYVAGDSALYYARVYRQSEAIATGFAATGSAMAATAVFTWFSCHGFYCPDAHTTRTIRRIGWSGLGVIMIGTPFDMHAGTAMRASIDFYNTALRR